MRITILLVELIMLSFLVVPPKPIVPIVPTCPHCDGSHIGNECSNHPEKIKLREHTALVPFNDRIENRSILWKY